MGHPRQGSGIQEGAYGQTERLGHGATRSTGSQPKIVIRTLLNGPSVRSLYARWATGNGVMDRMVWFGLSILIVLLV